MHVHFSYERKFVRRIRRRRCWGVFGGKVDKIVED